MEVFFFRGQRDPNMYTRRGRKFIDTLTPWPRQAADARATLLNVHERLRKCNDFEWLSTSVICTRSLERHHKQSRWGGWTLESSAAAMTDKPSSGLNVTGAWLRLTCRGRRWWGSALCQYSAEFSSYYSGNRYDFRLTREQLSNTPARLEDESNPPLSLVPRRTPLWVTWKRYSIMPAHGESTKSSWFRWVNDGFTWYPSRHLCHATAKTVWLRPSVSLWPWTAAP